MASLLPPYGWIAVGSALGGMLRFWLGSEITARAGTGLPWGTFAINVVGAAVIGAASEWTHQQTVRFFVMVGLCGGFTTFSSYSLETLHLLRQGQNARAFLYAVGSMAVCLWSVWVGNMLARALRNG
ncbi:MAG: fluoride efflux transporter CrcB [Acidobacteria bacterium]|nr:fluoride efflux transporter CrcB [Acidobacteriota bacterium]